MQMLWCVIIGCGVLWNAAYGQPAQPDAAEMEAMERFANRPTARVTLQSRTVKVTAGATEAAIVAVQIEDPTQAPLRMSGLRIDLADEFKKDRIYLAVRHLRPTIDALHEINGAWPAFLARGRGSSNRCLGAGLFWQSKGHTLTASQCVLGDSWGLVAGAFRFSETQARTFAEALSEAGKALDGLRR